MSTPARLSVLLALIGALAIASSVQAGPVQIVNIPVGDLWFCEESFQDGVCETVINAGDSIAWDFSGAALPHTTSACGDSCDDPTDAPLWDSGTIDDGSTFQFTFSEPGTYLYRCNIHPSQMRGRIVVQAAPTEPEPPDTGEPEPAPVTPVTDEPEPPGPSEPPDAGKPVPLPDGAPEPEPSIGDADEALPEALPSTGLVREQSSSWGGWAIGLLAGLGAAFVAGALAYRRFG